MVVLREPRLLKKPLAARPVLRTFNFNCFTNLSPLHRQVHKKAMNCARMKGLRLKPEKLLKVEQPVARMVTACCLLCCLRELLRVLLGGADETEEYTSVSEHRKYFNLA